MHPLAEVYYRVLEDGQPSSFELTFENSAFSLAVDNGKARFALKVEVSSIEDAIRRVEEFMHSWVADMVLQTAAVPRRFVGPGCHVPGLGSQGIPVNCTLTVSGAAAEANSRLQYPWRHHPYSSDPLVASLIRRYVDYRRGKEQLTVLGYLVLSALETAFGGRKGVANECRVDFVVLSELGRLVSEVGGYLTARKISRGQNLREHTELETYWIERVVRELIDRAGARFTEPSRPLPILSLKQLPTL